MRAFTWRWQGYLAKREALNVRPGQTRGSADCGRGCAALRLTLHDVQVRAATGPRPTVLAVVLRAVPVVLRALAAVALAALPLAACGGSESGTASSPSSPTSSGAMTSQPTGGTGDAAQLTKERIATAWTEFFRGTTPADRKEQLLEDGETFAAIIDARADSPIAQQTTATVSTVSLTAARQAAVRYTVLIAGKPALVDQLGVAVRIDDAWKVSKSTFCQLLALEGSAPPACGHPAGGASVTPGATTASVTTASVNTPSATG